MALIGARATAALRRARRAAAITRVRTRAHRWASRGRAAPRPVAPADLGLAQLDLTGLTVLDVGPASGAVAAAAGRAGAAGVSTLAAIDDARAPADVVVLRDLERAPDPAGAVCRLRECTRVLAIIEAPATEWPGHEERGLIEILPSDPSAVSAGWSPSADGLRELCLVAGFSDIRFAVGPPAYRPRGWRPVHYRLVVHARP
jgi:hypothetical protein